MCGIIKKGLFVVLLCPLFLASSVMAQTSMKKGSLATGKKVYEEICFACHGLKGDGKGPSWFNTKPSPQVFMDL